MTRPSSPRAIVAPAVAALLATMLAGMPLLAAAQIDAASAEVPESLGAIHPMEAPALVTERRKVGDATHYLLAIQREGHAASPTPRPLPGEIASLSYQRYLDSFKFPIPEKFGTTVQKSGQR